MKMRKYFVMALVALGATAAFSSCQKDPKAYDALKVEFRDANNAVIKEFNQASFGAKKEITVVVTLGDSKEVTLKKLEVSVVTDNSTIKKPYTVSTIKGNAGDVKDKQVGTVKLADLQIAEGDYAKSGLKIVAVATDSRAKETKVECVYKKAGETGGETPAAAVEMKGWVNNNLGKADGGFSFIVKKSVKSDDKTADLVNDSEAGKGIAGKLKSNTELQFAHVESAEVDYSKATKELVAQAADGKTFEATIDGLKANSLFIAKDKTGTTFYLFKVTEIGANDKDYDGTNAVPTKSTNGNGGYMIFGYKSNK